MKAMVLGKPSSVSLEDVEQPHSDTGDSIVRVTHSGICGTDLKIFTGGIPAKYPLIMGHEMIGFDPYQAHRLISDFAMVGMHPFRGTLSLLPVYDSCCYAV